jgi:hypothetical protein
MSLSGEGKEILDHVADSLELERPMTVKVALAKGLSVSNGPISDEFPDGKNKWVIPEGIIKDKEFILFKHLIINEVGTPLNDAELHKHMLSFIEIGLRSLKKGINEKASMEDIRLAIL